jgi:hypothetical protein
MQDVSAATLIWFTVLIAPPLAFVVFFTIQKTRTGIQLSVSLLLIPSLLISLIMFIFGFRFTNPLISIFWLAGSYFLYCLLAASTLQIKFKPLRYLVLIVAALPICLGYILGTVGLLGLFFIVGDMVRPPDQTEEMETSLVCELTLTGFAGSSDYSVDLYESWPRIPFIRRRLAHLSVDPGDVSSADETCADALKTFRH